MTFAALATAGPAHLPKGPRCTVGTYVNTLAPAEAEGLRTMLDPESGWESQRISEAITKAGAAISGTTIARHRRGVCRCVR